MKETSANPMQAAAYAEHQAYPRSGSGNLQCSISFGEALPEDGARAAWRNVALRHPILRSGFSRVEADAPLHIREATNTEAAWTSLDWQAMPVEVVATKWAELLAADAALPFETTATSLVRFHAIRLPGNSHQYLFTCPDFLLDDLSVARVLLDWLVCLSGGSPAPRGDDAEPTPGNKAAWRDILAGATQPSAFRMRGKPSPATSLTLSREATTAFLDFCESRNLTPSVVLRVIWALTLCRFGADGNVMLTRCDLRGTSAEAGNFEQWLPAATTLNGTLGECFVAAEQQETLRLAHGWFSAETALQGLNMDADALATFFTWKGFDLNDIIHTALPRWINFDARIQTRPAEGLHLRGQSGSRLEVTLEGWPCEAESILPRIANLLSRLPSIAEEQVANISLLTEAERAELAEWSQGPAQPTKSATLLTAFRAVLEQCRARVAVKDGDYELTYEELDALSDKLAAHFAHLGLAGGWHTGLFLSPSSWIAIALLGCWKAGNSCIPLDPSAPMAWIEKQLSANDCGLVLCDAASAPLLDTANRRRIVLDLEWETLEVGDVPTPEIEPTSPAASLAGFFDHQPPDFRALSHGLLVQSASEGSRIADFREEDIFLAHSAAGGAAFFDEWLIPLLRGGCVLIPTSDILDPTTAAATHLRLTGPEWSNQAARWQRGEPAASTTLRRVLVETSLPVAAALAWWQSANAGRISTTTFYSPVGFLGLGLSGEPEHTTSPIMAVGWPSAGTQARVCAAGLHDLLPGYVGELVLTLPNESTASNAFAVREPNGAISLWEPRAEAAGLMRRLSDRCDIFFGASTWTLAQREEPAGVLEWPLTRGGWVDENALPQEIISPSSPSALVPKLPSAKSRGLPSQWNPIVTLRHAETDQVLVLIHPASGTVTEYGPLAQALGPDVRVLGIEARGVQNPDAAHTTIENSAASYLQALLEEEPHGVFALAGFGFGGAVALEMASQMESAGRARPRLALIGTSFSNALHEGSWITTMKGALKRMAATEACEPFPASSELARTHEAAWRKFRARPTSSSVSVLVPSDFPAAALSDLQVLLPAAAVETVKGPWAAMLLLPMAKRIATILGPQS